jgi:two-component system cell cycle response regulator DivK
VSKILVVEDDTLNREMLARRLAWEGHQVVVASDGDEAVQQARAELPDVILMDMGLPVMNGWQATRLLKSQPNTHQIPIIALTAYAMVEDRQKSLAAGCDDFETKPVTFTRLLGKINTLCVDVA